MAKFTPPSELDFTKPQTWPEWKSRWERFRIASKLKKEDGEVQVASLVYSMGMQAETIFKTFTFADDTGKTNHDVVLEKFNAHFVPTVNIIHERAKFHSRRQQTGENVETYIRALYEMASTCGYDGPHKEEQIRDQLVVGISDKECSEKLQLKEDLTLKTAIEVCRSSELVKSQMSSQTSVDMVRAHKKKPPQRANPHPQRPQAPQKRDQKRCNYCAYVHRVPNKCPAKGKKCTFCGTLNHFERACNKKKQRAKVHMVEEEPLTEEEPTFFLGAIDCPSTDAWYVNLTVNQVDIRFKIDTGADITCIPESLYRKMRPHVELNKCQVQLVTPAGPIHALGTFVANAVYKDKQYRFTVYVIDTRSTTPLLGRSVAVSMGLVALVENVSHKVFGEFGLMNCEPIRIKLKPNAQPYSLATPRRISEPLLKPVKEELDRMQQNGIISPITKPTDWCAPVVPVMKKTGKVRLCVDLKKLNQNVQREKFIMPTVDEIAAKLTNAKVFSTLDCSQSFWQLPIHTDDRPLTCFITPFGRYIFNRLPYGLNSSTEIFQRTLKELLQGIDGVFVDVDDMLIYAPDTQQHDAILAHVLQRIQDSGLKLNKSKCKFRTNRVVYQGQVFTADGMTPDPSKVEAINKFLAPTNVEEVRRFVGMVNYLARYIPSLSQVMQPILELLKSDAVFTWDHRQEDAFKEVKQILSSAAVLAYYDMTKPTYISADASSYGLGACLMQKSNEELKPIAYASRSLTPSERKWAQIDKECLALVWACEKFSHFVLGLPEFKLLTDHKPLVSLINTKDLDRTPIRVQRLLMRLLRFNAIAEYVPGKNLIVADALSRAVKVQSTEISEISGEVNFYVQEVQRQWPASEEMLQQIATETTKDTGMSTALTLTLNGWPDYIKDVPEVAKPYYSSRASLSVIDGILVYLDRIVIPITMREEVLNKLHAGHSGMVACKRLASTSLWWPSIGSDIENHCRMCAVCEENMPAKSFEPLMPTKLPDGPWHKVGVDAFELDKQSYIVAVDYYSRYLEVMHLPDMTSKTVILKLKVLFGRYGIPYELVTDGGTQFTSNEFKEFSSAYSFRHSVSSPTYARANGEAEAYVKIAKKCLKTDDPALSLLLYRSTPHQSTNRSPASLFLGRQIRTVLPTITRNLTPKWPDDGQVRANDEQYKNKMKYFHDRRYDCKSTTPFTVGQQVRIRTQRDKQWEPGTIVSYTGYPRSYMVTTHDGRSTYRRNSKHIRPSYSVIKSRSDTKNNRAALFREFIDRRMRNTASAPKEQEQTVTNTNTGRQSAVPDKTKDIVIRRSVRLAKRAQTETIPADQNRTDGASNRMTRSGRTIKPIHKMNL